MNWFTDMVFSVPCPTCKAPAGVPCTNAGHQKPDLGLTAISIHAKRSGAANKKAIREHFKDPANRKKLVNRDPSKGKQYHKKFQKAGLKYTRPRRFGG